MLIVGQHNLLVIKFCPQNSLQYYF